MVRPILCDNCRMSYQFDLVDQKDNIQQWKCSACGYINIRKCCND